MLDSNLPVVVVAPGGVKDRAGIGRLVITVTRFWREQHLRPPLEVVDPYGPAILPLAPLYFTRALLQILWRARRGRITLLHVHMAAWGSALRKGLIVHLGKALGLPVILHLHGSGLDEFHRWLPRPGRRLLARTLARADRTIVVGEHWRRVVVGQIGLDPSRVVVLPNAVAGPLELPAGDQRTGPCRILFLGRLEAEKGLPELLDALADAQVSALDWCVRLAGPGDAARVQQRATALGLGGRVTVTGWVPELEARRCLAEADVFVLPSHHEGLSMALLEAMAFGLAIITTPVGATEDAIVDGVSGLLVPVGDHRALAAALARAISDRRLRAQLQAAAHQRFCEKFDIAEHCRRVQALYREVCGEDGVYST